MFSKKIDLIFESSLSKKEAITRRLAVLFGTRKGEQALDREFGIDWSFLDQPTEVAKAMLSAEIITQASKYVPEIMVSSIDYTADINGTLTPKVRVEEVTNE